MDSPTSQLIKMKPWHQPRTILTALGHILTQRAEDFTNTIIKESGKPRRYAMISLNLGP